MGGHKSYPKIPLPTNANPTGERCISLFIPDDDQWERQLYSQVVDMTKWYMWERDLLKRGKPVADRWQKALDTWSTCHMTTPFLQFRLVDCLLEYTINSGEDWLPMPDVSECFVIDIRQNEENPCKLEKKVGIEGEWEEFANIQLCPPKIRNNGGKLQWFNPETDTWEDTPGQGDERFDGEAPTPTPVEGESMPCLSALNVMSVYSTTFSQVRANVVAGEYAVAVGATITGILQQFIPAAVISTICLTIAGIALSLAEAGLDDLLSTDTTDTLKCILNDNAGEDGSYNSAQFNSIQEAVEVEYTGLKASIINEFFDAMGPVGLTRAAGLGGITTGDCSDCEDDPLCAVGVTDLKTGMHGLRLATYEEKELWVGSSNNHDAGIYTESVGFESTNWHASHRALYVVLECPDVFGSGQGIHIRGQSNGANVFWRTIAADGETVLQSSAIGDAYADFDFNQSINEGVKFICFGQFSYGNFLTIEEIEIY